jgi:alkylation response protein AidB-like acyl-CoA dehydrogenase
VVERLASAGLAVPTWNRSHGGLATTAQVQQVVEQELAAAGTIAHRSPVTACA